MKIKDPTMLPFIKLTDFPFVICLVCRYAYVTKEVEPHLKKHHKGISIAARRGIIQQVKDLPGMIEDRRGLLTWPKPPPTTDPIPYYKNAVFANQISSEKL
jgi:hypothetical protein